MEDHVKKARSTGTRRFNRAKGIPHKAWDYGRKDTLRRGERVGSLGAEYFKDTRAEAARNSDSSGYDFGQSRKEKYVGPGTGSITITPDRKGYSKTASGKRMKISETNTPRRPNVIIESSYTGSEYRKHLDSQKTRGNPAWEKESASLNKQRRLGQMARHTTKTWDKSTQSWN